MQLGLILGYSGARYAIDMDLVRHAETLGFSSVWTAEAYGSDAVSPAAWILAQTSRIKVGTGIIQMAARTPAMAAMTAMTLQALSQDRFILGVGPSGPQVIEGWHGVPYGRPITRTREYIEIVRKILAREEPLTHQGYHYQIPNTGRGTTGLGKPLKSILHSEPGMKIYTGAMTDAGVRAAAAIADGVLFAFMSARHYGVFADAVEAGFAEAGGGKSLATFDIAPFVTVRLGDDLDACRLPVKQQIALYVGGMGARDKNFYNDYVSNIGYPDAAAEIQKLFLSGKQPEAVAAVPDDLVDDLALVGPKERIVEQLAAWQEAGKRGEVGTLLVGGASKEALEVLAETVL